MANTYAPFGFRQYRHLEGNAPTMGFETFRIASSDASLIFTGDPVVTQNSVTASTGSAGSGYGRYITGSTNAGTTYGTSVAVLGIFMGCEYYNSNVGRTVWSAWWPGNGTAGQPDVQAYVCTDPNMLYTAQASTGAVLGTSNVGQGIGYSNSNSSVALGSTNYFGNQVTGQSGAGLVSSGTLGVGPGSSYPFNLWDLAGTYSGAAGMPAWNIAPATGALSGFLNGYDPTSAGAIWIVKPQWFTYNTFPAVGFTGGSSDAV